MVRWKKYLLGAAVAAGAVVTAAALFSSLAVVRDAGVVLRLGRVERILAPGFHFLAPFGIDELIPVAASRSLREELGYRTASGVELPTYEAEMPTSDGVQVAVQWALTYRIVDPVELVSSFLDPARALHAFALTKMATWIGDHSADEALALTRQDLSRERTKLEEEIKEAVQEELDRYRSGLLIDSVVIGEIGGWVEGEALAEPAARRREAGDEVLVGFGLLPVYVLREWEQALVTQFGKPVGAPIVEPGLHSPIPLVQRVRRFDRRFRVYESDFSELYSRDRQVLVPQTFAIWRITDASVFHRSLRDEQHALARLDDLFDGEARDAVAERELSELIRSARREEIEERLRDLANERGAVLGLEVLEVRMVFRLLQR